MIVFTVVGLLPRFTTQEDTPKPTIEISGGNSIVRTAPIGIVLNGVMLRV